MLITALFVFGNSQAQDKVRYTQKAPEIETARSVYEVYNKGDWAKMESLYTENAVITNNQSGEWRVLLQSDALNPFRIVTFDF